MDNSLEKKKEGGKGSSPSKRKKKFHYLKKKKRGKDVEKKGFLPSPSRSRQKKKGCSPRLEDTKLKIERKTPMLLPYAI